MMATPPPGRNYAQAGPNDETGQINLHSLDYQDPIEEQSPSPSTSSFVVSHNQFPFPVSGDSAERDSRLKEKVRELMSSIRQERDEELEELKRERDMVRKQLQKKQEELNAKEELLVLAQQEMAEKDERQLQEVLKEREAKDSLMKELEASRQAVKEKDQQLQEKDSMINELEASNKSLKEEVDKLTAKNQQLENTIRDLMQQIRALNQNMTIMQGDNEAIRQDCVFKKELSDTVRQIEERADRRVDEKLDEKVEAALKTKIAEIMSQLSISNNVSAQAAHLAAEASVTAPAAKLQADYKRLSPKSRSKTPSPSQSPVNFLTPPPETAENNNLDQ